MSAVDLVAFVRAALDAKEREAQVFLERTGTSLLAQRLYREQLAEVEAKRRILDEHERANRPLPGDDPMVAQGEQVMGERVIGLLAQPYAGREGWREGWRA